MSCPRVFSALARRFVEPVSSHRRVRRTIRLLEGFYLTYRIIRERPENPVQAPRESRVAHPAKRPASPDIDLTFREYRRIAIAVT